jgi:hypothetical protein
MTPERSSSPCERASPGRARGSLGDPLCWRARSLSSMVRPLRSCTRLFPSRTRFRRMRPREPGSRSRGGTSRLRAPRPGPGSFSARTGLRRSHPGPVATRRAGGILRCRGWRRRRGREPRRGYYRRRWRARRVDRAKYRASRPPPASHHFHTTSPVSFSVLPCCWHVPLPSGGCGGLPPQRGPAADAQSGRRVPKPAFTKGGRSRATQ